jgi:hypothetical protein
MIEDYETLVKVLTKYNYIYSHDYQNKELFDNCELVNSEWCDYRKDPIYKVDPPKRMDASTYKDCTSTEYYTKDGIVYARLIIKDGDSYTGYPIGKRCEFLFKVPDNGNLIFKKICILTFSKVVMQAKHEYYVAKEEKEQQEILQNAIIKITTIANGDIFTK